MVAGGGAKEGSELNTRKMEEVVSSSPSLVVSSEWMLAERIVRPHSPIAEETSGHVTECKWTVTSSSGPRWRFSDAGVPATPAEPSATSLGEVRPWVGRSPNDPERDIGVLVGPPGRTSTEATSSMSSPLTTTTSVEAEASVVAAVSADSCSMGSGRKWAVSSGCMGKSASGD